MTQSADKLQIPLASGDTLDFRGRFAVWKVCAAGPGGAGDRKNAFIKKYKCHQNMI